MLCIMKAYGLDLLGEFNKLSQEIETRIPEVQELINKRLEEL